MFDYILDTLFMLWEAPYRILYIAVFVGFSYCAAMMIVGIPTSIWEAATKKKVREDIEKKVIIVVTVFIALAAIIFDAYQKAT